MAHRSGGGSHSGGHYGGGGHGGSSGPIYSKRPFHNSRRFRYYDRNGMERYLYSSEMPRKMSIFSLIVSLLPLIPFILIGIFTLVYPLFFLEAPKPLDPVYESTGVHIMDKAGVIDNEGSLENVLQEFEKHTGISPYIMTVYDDEWKNYNELWEYAYYIYINTFSDEQHFLIVYSEPENAAESDFVDWSWEAIQGDDTDPILTESKADRFGESLHDNLLRNNFSVGEAFEFAFGESLTYMMKSDTGNDASVFFLFGVIWNAFVLIFVFSIINQYIIGKRDYQEVPMEGSPQNGQMYQNGQIYQSNGTQYNTADMANTDYYNNDARFRDPEYYDDDARYHGSTAYEAGKK